MHHGRAPRCRREAGSLQPLHRLGTLGSAQAAIAAGIRPPYLLSSSRLRLGLRSSSEDPDDGDRLPMATPGCAPAPGKRLQRPGPGQPSTRCRGAVGQEGSLSP